MTIETHIHLAVLRHALADLMARANGTDPEDELLALQQQMEVLQAQYNAAAAAPADADCVGLPAPDRS